MVAHLTAKVLAGVLGLVLIQCSLTIDEEELGGERLSACASNEKACTVQGVRQCVGLDDPRFGCASDSCIPCNLANATARCREGECVKSTCHPSWDDCNDIDSDGCEVSLNNNVEHCGECDEPCPSLPQAEVKCGSGQCYVRVCNDGFLDCNGKVDDGCEIDENDPDNCGECGEPCGGVCCADQCCDGVCQEQACSE